jgi:hypothetical protein
MQRSCLSAQSDGVVICCEFTSNAALMCDLEATGVRKCGNAFDDCAAIGIASLK